MPYKDPEKTKEYQRNYQRQKRSEEVKQPEKKPLTLEDIKTAGTVADSVECSFESANPIFSVFGLSQNETTLLYKAVFIGGGDSYDGYFKATNNGDNTITIGAGLAKAGNIIIEIAEATVTATGAGYIVVLFGYSGGYTATVQFITSFSALTNGMDYDLLHTVDWADGAVTAVKRNKAGWAFPTGKAV